MATPAHSSLQPLGSPENALPVVIIGGGLSGLACAQELLKANTPFLLIESDDCLGGRVQTDEREGFLLDRGFQVILSGYPELKQFKKALNLKPFFSGAQVFYQGHWVCLANPLKHPFVALKSLSAPFLNLLDVLRLVALGLLLLLAPPCWLPKGLSTLQFLHHWGFSEAFIQAFWRPFYQGIFLESELETDVAKFFYTLKFFLQAPAALPANGMKELPACMAKNLPDEALLTGQKVLQLIPPEKNSGLDFWQVVLASGQVIQAKSVVLATTAHSAKALATQQPPQTTPQQEEWVYRSAQTFYFKLSKATLNRLQAPIGPWLYLNGSPQAGSSVTHFCFPSLVSSAYAPQNQVLLSVTAVQNLENQPPEKLNPELLLQALLPILGSAILEAVYLDTAWVESALPAVTTHYGLLNPPAWLKNSKPGLFFAGDYLDFASINGAVLTGKQAAKAVLAYV